MNRTNFLKSIAAFFGFGAALNAQFKTTECTESTDSSGQRIGTVPCSGFKPLAGVSAALPLKWEYKVITDAGNDRDLICNLAGEEGYELVAVDNYRMFFKRRKV